MLLLPPDLLSPRWPVTFHRHTGSHPSPGSPTRGSPRGELKGPSAKPSHTKSNASIKAMGTVKCSIPISVETLRVTFFFF